jgi:hypothetical protein
VNDREKIFRKQLQLGNTSCLADWDNFRNFTLNGHEMRFCTHLQTSAGIDIKHGDFSTGLQLRGSSLKKAIFRAITQVLSVLPRVPNQFTENVWKIGSKAYLNLCLFVRTVEKNH